MEMSRAELRPKLAEQGWSDEEIELLEKEIELARQKAKAQSYRDGETLAAQEVRMRDAEMEARKFAHERMHAELDAIMEKLRQMGDAKALPTKAEREHELEEVEQEQKERVR